MTLAVQIGHLTSDFKDIIAAPHALSDLQREQNGRAFRLSNCLSLPFPLLRLEHPICPSHAGKTLESSVVGAVIYKKQSVKPPLQHMTPTSYISVALPA